MFNHLKIFTVHIQPGIAPTLQQPLFVREGFNVFAFVFTFIWAFYRRLWLPGLLIFAVYALLMLLRAENMLNPLGLSVLQLGLQVVVGFHGNDWVRAKLERKGYIMADISAGDSLLRAEQRYFERCLARA